MACYVGHSGRDLFLKDPGTPYKGASVRLNHIVSGRRLEKITQVISYTSLAIAEFNDTLFQHRQTQEGWNKNMAEHFDPSWVSVLDESIQEWINRYTCPGWIFVPRKPHPFGNEYQKIVCAKYKAIYNVETVERKDQPRVMGDKEFDEKGETASLMVRTTKPLLGTGKVVVMDSGLCVL